MRLIRLSGRDRHSSQLTWISSPSAWGRGLLPNPLYAALAQGKIPEHRPIGRIEIACVRSMHDCGPKARVAMIQVDWRLSPKIKTPADASPIHSISRDDCWWVTRSSGRFYTNQVHTC